MKTATFVTLLGLALAPLGLAQSDSLGPAPTESYGCEPHGDHYHCEGHVSETAAVDGTAVTTPTPTPDDHDHDHDHDHDEEDHDHDHDEEEDGDASDNTNLPPSPTASVGCEPHGDHWHCDGPAQTDASSNDEASTTSESSPQDTGGVVAQIVPLAGALAAVVLAF